MKKILIDLTPMRINGSNGGNTLFIIELLKVMMQEKGNKYFFQYNDPKVKKLLSKITKNNFIRSHEPKYELFKSNILLLFFSKIQYFITFVDNKFKKRFFIFRVIKKLLSLAGLINTKLINLINSINSKQIFDIVFSPYGHFLNVKTHKRISIIYDLQHLDLKFMFDDQELMSRNYHYNNSIKLSDKVLTISKFSKSRLDYHYPNSSTKFVPILLPCLKALEENSVEFSSNKFENLQLSKSNNFFYIPSNYWPHKNHLSLLIGINIFLKKSKSKINFIFSGKFTNMHTKNLLNAYIKKNNLTSYIYLYDYLSKKQVNYLYKKCLAIISPSLYEGYGMTLLEAIYFKKRCIVSDIPAHREICDKANTSFFDPFSPNDIAKKIELFLKNPNKNKFKSICNPKVSINKYINEIMN